MSAPVSAFVAVLRNHAEIVLAHANRESPTSLPTIPFWKGLGADSEDKREPSSNIDTVVVDSLKALAPERPIREADC